MIRLIKSRAVLPPHARGFTLFEILVTVVVMAIGLLGLAGLQIAGLRTSHAALQRTTAMQLAQDIAERIRANTAAAHLYENFTTTADTRPDAGADCRMETCTPEQIAAHDMRQWQAEVDAGTTSGLRGGAIDITPDADHTYYIQVRWYDGANPRSYTLSLHP